MGKFRHFLFASLLLLIPSSGICQTNIASTSIELTNINLRGAPVVLGSVSLTITEPGTVLVTFDGICVSDEDDLIVLAASDSTNWSVNDGNISVQAYDADINRNSFSHSRSYVVGAGTHDFYAIGENFINQGGSGVASVYGNLIAKFYPDSGTNIVANTGINITNINVLGGPVTLATVDINAPQAGKVLVNFDGQCYTSVGDRIVVAASDTPTWNVNDGNIGIEAINTSRRNRSFRHSRLYNVAAGPNTFYAVAENFVETDGNGIGSFYGNLSAVYFPNENSIAPNSMHATISQLGVSETNVDVRTAPVIMGDVTINPISNGTAIVTYNGSAFGTVGDRIIMAASDTNTWGVNSGNVNMEAIDADLNNAPFAHTRVYPITAGSHTFNGICHNFVETDGTGITSNYASLTVEFWPDAVLNTNDVILLSENIILFPNPTSNIVFLKMESEINKIDEYRIFDISGRLLDHQNNLNTNLVEIDVSRYQSGNYIITIQGENYSIAKQFIVD